MYGRTSFPCLGVDLRNRPCRGRERGRRSRSVIDYATLPRSSYADAFAQFRAFLEASSWKGGEKHSPNGRSRVHCKQARAFLDAMTKPLLMLALGAIPAFSQPLTFGVKAGVPWTDFVNAVDSGTLRFNTNTNRYIIGPTVEFRLPFGFGIEVDALYRRLHYASANSLIGATTLTRTTGDAWEFPLLAKYRLPSKLVRPYIDGGLAIDTLSGLKQTIRQVLATGGTTTTATSSPPDLDNNTIIGVVVGIGIDIHALIVHISPEVRYTRWSSQHFLSTNGLLESNQNQGEVLLGITF